MNIIGNAKKAIGEVSKIIIVPKKKETPILPTNYTTEKADEYANRINKMRKRGY